MLRNFDRGIVYQEGWIDSDEPAALDWDFLWPKATQKAQYAVIQEYT